MNCKRFILLLSMMTMGSATLSAQHAILIGWDGAQRDHVKECLSRGELPVLQSIIKDGSWSDIEIRGTTDTKAGWTQILTGYDPDMTGVYSNSRYQPIPVGLSVFERLEAALGKDKIVTLAVIGKKGHVDDDGPQMVPLDKKLRVKLERIARRLQKENGDDIRIKRDGGLSKVYPGYKIVTENGRKFISVPGKPYFNTKNGMDLFLNGLKQDSVVGKNAIELLEKHRNTPLMIFVHFAQVDHSGHGFGENSKEYNDALISADTWTGKILEKLKQLGLKNTTEVFVTADHGFNEGEKHHKSAPQVFLASTVKNLNPKGDRADVTPTILSGFGLDSKKLEPPTIGTSLRTK